MNINEYGNRVYNLNSAFDLVVLAARACRGYDNGLLRAQYESKRRERGERLI